MERCRPSIAISTTRPTIALCSGAGSWVLRSNAPYPAELINADKFRVPFAQTIEICKNPTERIVFVVVASLQIASFVMLHEVQDVVRGRQPYNSYNLDGAA